MKELPILFNGPMVRAILDGRKTQTRRVVKRPKWAHPHADIESDQFGPQVICLSTGCLAPLICPYGQPGDRLWVRESGWERPERTPKMMRDGADTWPRFAYAADDWNDDDRADFKRWGFKVRPSIHMPRWASRILLEVTAVRVERLNDISEQDAKAEGVQVPCDKDGRTLIRLTGRISPSKFLFNPVQGVTAGDLLRLEYAELWEQINGPGSWARNDWVWVVEFRRVMP